MVEVWPLRGLRLQVGDLDLRPVTEADLPSLCAILPADLEMDPSATRYAALDDPSNRRAILVQSYWRCFGLWSPDDWALPFAVRLGGDLIGMQTLEGPDYRAERTVDSSSWLVRDARGKGSGKDMRRAILELAFRHLGAEAAVSSAVVDNGSSLGVSRALGYRDTHTSTLQHSGETLQHVRVERADWVASGRGTDVEITGVDAALPFFGLGDGG
ncbi:GNAT family N-acetyltransferase [Intrasporangium oryzae]|nr:GNAT family N-acetyltransferase [Intrasporangium oryzae]